MKLRRAFIKPLEELVDYIQLRIPTREDVEMFGIFVLIIVTTFSPLIISFYYFGDPLGVLLVLFLTAPWAWYTSNVILNIFMEDD